MVSYRRTLISLALLALLLGVGLARVATREPEPTYDPGECTAWAYAKRPELTRGTDGLSAADWEDWAIDHGFAVDDLPRPGDVAVWERNVGAGPEGHVAYVERVAPDGIVFVSEANAGGCRDVAYVRLTPGRLSTARFIHRR